jgi:hypothetical protein
MGAFDGLNLYQRKFRVVTVPAAEWDFRRAYEKFIVNLHTPRQSCPGQCTVERCRNSHCTAHPNFKRE